MLTALCHSSHTVLWDKYFYPLFYRGENWGPFRIKNIVKVRPLVNGNAGFWTNAWPLGLCIFHYNKVLERLRPPKGDRSPFDNILPTIILYTLTLSFELFLTKICSIKPKPFLLFLSWYYGLWSNLHHCLWNRRFIRHFAKEHGPSCQLKTWGFLISLGPVNVPGLNFKYTCSQTEGFSKGRNVVECRRDRRQAHLNWAVAEGDRSAHPVARAFHPWFNRWNGWSTLWGISCPSLGTGPSSVNNYCQMLLGSGLPQTREFTSGLTSHFFTRSTSGWCC